MKILAIANAFPKFQEEYSSSYIYKQLEGLSLKGNEVEIISPTIWIPKICGRISKKLRSYAEVPNKTNVSTMHIIYPKMILYNQMYKMWIRFPEVFSWIYIRQIMPIVEDAISNFKPDVIYVTGIFLEGSMGLLIKKKFGVSVVFIENSIPRLQDALKQGSLRKIYTKIVEDSNAYICVSRKQKEILECEGFNTTRVYILPNGFQIDYLQVKRNPSDFFRIITIGFLDDRKGYPLIFEAIAYLKQKGFKIRYTIIGDGHKRIEYSKKVKELGIEEECVFVGRIPHKEVEIQLLQSDLFVLPSQGESFGIAYLEAMACHLPTIMTKGEGISYLLENEKNCLMIEQGDVKQLCYYMEKAYKDRNWLVNIAENAYQKSKEFSYEKNAEELLRIINCSTETFGICRCVYPCE